MPKTLGVQQGWLPEFRVHEVQQVLSESSIDWAAAVITPTTVAVVLAGSLSCLVDGAYWVLLVSRVDNSLAVSSEGLEDVVGCLRPYERLGVLVPLADPLADVGLELGDAAVR